MLADGNILDAGDGREDGSGAYTKFAGLNPNDGTVYVVAGHASHATIGTADHPVMFFSQKEVGSCVMTVHDNVLTFENIRATGQVSDTFTLVKRSVGTRDPVPCSEPFTLLVTSVFDNESNRSYFPGGPDGTDPYDDLRSIAEENEVEVLADDPSFYWEATYGTSGSGSVTGVEVLLALRAEEGAEGTVRIEVSSGATLLTTHDVASSSLVNSDNPSVPPSQIVVFVPVDGEDVAVVNNLRVRVFQPLANDGKKVFWSYTQMTGVTRTTICGPRRWSKRSIRHGQ